MLCRYCKREIEPDSIFCRYCGEKVARSRKKQIRKLSTSDLEEDVKKMQDYYKFTRESSKSK